MSSETERERNGRSGAGCDWQQPSVVCGKTGRWAPPSVADLGSFPTVPPLDSSHARADTAILYSDSLANIRRAAIKIILQHGTPQKKQFKVDGQSDLNPSRGGGEVKVGANQPGR